MTHVFTFASYRVGSISSKLPSREYIYLLLHIDDMLTTSKNRSSIDKLKVQLSSVFKMKDLGEAKMNWV